MIDFKKEEERYEKIMLIKSVLKEPEVDTIIRQLQVDLMNHFGIYFKLNLDINLERNIITHSKPCVIINNPSIGYDKPYEELINIVTGIYSENQIIAEFEKEYYFKEVTFKIKDCPHFPG